MTFSKVAAALLQKANEETDPLLKKAALRSWLDYLNKLIKSEKDRESKRKELFRQSIAKCWRKPQRAVCQDTQTQTKKQVRTPYRGQGSLKICTVPGCDAAAESKGLCNKHRIRRRRKNSAKQA